MDRKNSPYFEGNRLKLLAAGDLAQIRANGFDQRGGHHFAERQVAWMWRHIKGQYKFRMGQGCAPTLVVGHESIKGGWD